MPRRSRQNPGPGRGQKVDWDELFNGDRWACVQGADFEGAAENFRHYVLQRARKADVRVKTRIMRKRGQISVWVQKTGSRASDAPEGQLFRAPDTRLERARALARVIDEHARTAAAADLVAHACAPLEEILALAAEALAGAGAKKQQLTDALNRGWVHGKDKPGPDV